jgi:hypothetical protein
MSEVTISTRNHNTSRSLYNEAKDWLVAYGVNYQTKIENLTEAVSFTSPASGCAYSMLNCYSVYHYEIEDDSQAMLFKLTFAQYL